jgi:hypothetical protein
MAAEVAAELAADPEISATHILFVSLGASRR